MEGSRFVKSVLAFEMETGGHHASYIRNFADQWVQNCPGARLCFVVSRKFFHLHSDIVDFIQSLNSSAVEIQSISEEDERWLQDSWLLPEWRGWQLFCRYAKELEARHALLLYSDKYQLPALAGKKPHCHFSCIYFRPTYHYSRLSNYNPTFGESLVAVRKWLLMWAFLKLRTLDCVYTLDPYAVEYILDIFRPKARIELMPDTFVYYESRDESVAELRKMLNPEPSRTVFLLLGILDSRKGPLQLLEAIIKLPVDYQRRLCLLLVGAVAENIRSNVHSAVKNINQTTAAQVVLQDRYVSDCDVQPYYEIADVALTTYQKHKGMSSALIRAALAGTPVLSSSYGLMGDLVTTHKLGSVVDTSDLDSFANGLKESLDRPCADFQPELAVAFAKQHSPDALGRLLSRLLSFVDCSDR